MQCVIQQRSAGVTVFLLVLLAAPLCCWALVDIDWNLVGGYGNWSEPSNWTPANAPDAANEYAHVRAAAGATTVNLNVSPTIDGLSMESATATLNLQGYMLNVGADGLTNSGIVVGNAGNSHINGAISNNLGGQIRVNNNYGLYFGAPSITDNGTISMASTGNTTALYLTADVTLSGSGQVSLSNNDHNFFLGDKSARRLTQAAGHTIRGSGAIGYNQLILTNNGLIEANQSTPLLIDLTDGVANVNTGIVQANGGILRLYGTLLDNSGGTIQALAGSTVRVIASGISGGTLTTVGSGVIEIYGFSHLAGIANLGTIRVPNNEAGDLEGTISNTGTIQVAGSGNRTYLYLASNVTLTGNGQLLLSGSVNSYFRGDNNSRRLTNDLNHSIRGSGHLGDNNMLLVNRGVIEANQFYALYVDLTDGAGNLNLGTMQANGGNLQLYGTTLDNTGGKIQALGGAVQLLSGATVIGGSLNSSGSGAVEAYNGATVRDLSNLGAFRVPDNQSPQLQGTIDNLGAINIGTNCTIPATIIDGIGTINVGGANSSLTADHIRQGALSIGANARATIRTGTPANDPARTNRVGALTIAGGAAPTGTLDLNNQSLIIDYAGPIGTALSDVTAQIRSGRNGVDGNDQTNWNGPGIVTTKGRQENVAAQYDLYNLGAINNADLVTAGINDPLTTFGGQAVTPNTVLVKYTYSGDADLNGRVDGDDYTYWLNGFLGLTDPAVQGWLRGDFDYNGVTDGDDYTQWLNSFLFGGPQLAGTDGPAQVPEPSTWVLTGLGAAAALAYVRRRRSR